MTPAAVSVLGAGFMGRNHAHAIGDHPALNLAAVADVDADAARSAAEAYGAGTATTDPERAVADADAVVVATPEAAHAEGARTVLDHDRHLLLEKPVTVDTDEAWALADRAAERDLVTGVSFILRYDPGYAGVRKAVADGTVGDPVAVRAVRGVTTAESERIGARGHPLYYLSIHDIDAARWCVGTDVEQVTAVERRGELEHLDVPDATNVTLTFTDGTVATVAGYGVLPADTPGGITAGFELVGTRGTASVDTPGTTLAVTGPAGHDRPDVRHWPVINGRMDGAVRRQVDALAAAVAGEGELLASLRDGARAQTVADAALAAFDSETPVAVDSR